MLNRFENLSRHEQIKTLVRIHNKLNKELFDNKLHKARSADIDSISPYIDLSDYVFIAISDVKRGAEACYYTGPVRKIYFQNEWLEPFMPSCESIKKQKLYLVMTMLHEMIHQYMDETQQYTGEHNGHDITFYKEAKKRGLINEGGKTHPKEITEDLARIAYSVRFCTDSKKEEHRGN